MGQVLSKTLGKKLPQFMQKHESRTIGEAMEDFSKKKISESIWKKLPTNPTTKNSILLHGSPAFQQQQNQDGVGKESYARKQPSYQSTVNSMTPSSSLSSSSNNSTSTMEMPDDLIQFLNAAGPIQRKVDKSMTSPKIYDAILQEEQMQQQQQQQGQQQQPQHSIRTSKLPKRRFMPMKEDFKDSQDWEEHHSLEAAAMGMAVPRTTNFSTQIREEYDKNLLRLKQKEIYHFILEFDRQFQNRSHSKIEKDENISAFLDSLLTDPSLPNIDTHNKIRNSLQNASTAESTKNKVLLQNTLRYIGIPRLMFDTDDSLVGAWSHQVQDLKYLQLKEVPKGTVQLAIESQD